MVEGSRFDSSAAGVVEDLEVVPHDWPCLGFFFRLHFSSGFSVVDVVEVLLSDSVVEGLEPQDEASVVGLFSLHLSSSRGSSVLFSSELEPDESDSLLDESDSFFLLPTDFGVVVVEVVV